MWTSSSSSSLLLLLGDKLGRHPIVLEQPTLIAQDWLLAYHILNHCTFSTDLTWPLFINKIRILNVMRHDCFMISGNHKGLQSHYTPWRHLSEFSSARMNTDTAHCYINALCVVIQYWCHSAVVVGGGTHWLNVVRSVFLSSCRITWIFGSLTMKISVSA